MFLTQHCLSLLYQEVAVHRATEKPSSATMKHCSWLTHTYNPLTYHCIISVRRVGGSLQSHVSPKTFPAAGLISPKKTKRGDFPFAPDKLGRKLGSFYRPRVGWIECVGVVLMSGVACQSQVISHGNTGLHTAYQSLTLKA